MSLSGFAFAAEQDQEAAIESHVGIAEAASPYADAMFCVREFMQQAPTRIGVSEIADKTGKNNYAEGGTGTMMTQGATDMFYTSLANLGIRGTEATPQFRGAIDWYQQKGAKISIELPTYVIMGSLDVLDLLPGTAKSFGILGLGADTVAYKAVGGMDVRLVKMLGEGGETGRVLYNVAPKKEYLAVEDRAGFGRFVGKGHGLSMFSFELARGARTPMQLTTRWLIDYAATSLVLDLAEDKLAHSAETKAYLTGCRGKLRSAL